MLKLADMRKTVFLTTNYFESSLKPLFAPRSLQGRFLYTNFPEEESLGLPFFMDGSYRITNLPGLKGFLIFWNENNIQFSHNSGQLVGPIIVKKNMQFLYPSISQMGMKIYTIASYDNELAILTENGRFFYGTLGLLSTSIFEVTPEDIDINNTALMFIGVGFIFVVTPIKDPVFQAYDFHICIINIQKLLQQSEIGLKTCKAELLQGNFDKTMHILDMSDTLHLYGVMVPQPTQNPIPIITISNPHSLGLKLKMYEDGYTYDGNIKFKINITLMQQYLSGKAHDSFISNIKVPSLSTITLDLIDRGLSCIDLQPPTGLISIGCNWAKKIIIRNTLNACTKDILTPVELQKNYTYILEKGTYDPSFNSRLRLDLQDQAVIYDYEELGCPQLVYFNNPWKPVIELYCDLTTSFAIYVYGAFPQRLLPDYPLALLVMLSMLFILWLGYVIPKLSSTEKGRVIIGFFQELWNPFMKREKRKRPSHR
uniref:Cation channel sperm-associated auxiliary subunit delta n=1 Tax=Monodelphis domestica TaxID=13616 RepID=A0A5F8HEE0_MONDO